MIDVKTAVKAALEYYQLLYEQRGLRDVELEKVELVEGDWLVTLGIHTKDLSQVVYGKPAFKREYKILKTDAETGEAKSMKIRQIQQQ